MTRENSRRVAPGAGSLRGFVALMGLVALLLGHGALAQDSADGDALAPTQAVLNINQADADELASGLIGVGLVKAKEIVRYREMFGDFVAVEELADVKGIGMATVEKNRDRIVLAVP